MYLKMYKKYGAVLSSLFLAAQSINAQTDSLFLTIDQLFERGVQHSLQLQADVMKESMAQERIGNGDYPILHIRKHRTGHKIMRLIWHSLSIRVVKSEVLFIKRI